MGRRADVAWLYTYTHEGIDSIGIWTQVSIKKTNLR